MPIQQFPYGVGPQNSDIAAAVAAPSAATIATQVAASVPTRAQIQSDIQTYGAPARTSELPPGTSSIWADGILKSASATITKAMPSGQYLVSSPSAITVTTNGGKTVSVTPNVLSTLNVPSAQTSVTVVPEFIGTIWQNSSSTISGSLSAYMRAYASSVGMHVVLFSGSTNSIAYSSDGMDNWTVVQNLPGTYSWTWLIASPTRYWTLVGGTNTAAYSTDGINWTLANFPISISPSNAIYSTVGSFFVVGNSNSASTTYYTSPDAIIWTSRTMPSAGQWVFSVANNILFGMNSSYNTNAAYSTNGTTWTSMTMPETQNWKKVVYANGVYAATITYGGIRATSTNGTTWTLRTQATAPSGGSWSDVVTTGNSFLQYTSTTSVALSTDGINWTYKYNNPSFTMGPNSIDMLIPVGDYLYGLGTVSSTTRSTRTTVLPYPSGQYFQIAAGPVTPVY
jgi:hypothetical protein